MARAALLGAAAALCAGVPASCMPPAAPGSEPGPGAPAGGPQREPAVAAYRDPTRPVGERVADLLSRMTLVEKVAQLRSVHRDHTHLDDPVEHRFSPDQAKRLLADGIGEVSPPNARQDAKSAAEFANAVQRYLVEETRLGIPAILHVDSLHGLEVPGATSFPQAIALAATFDPDLVEQVFTVASRQARARGIWQVLAPVLDVARRSAWGRFEETYGENP
ncbi:MAG: hypothetical protein JOZ69_07660 [Myxococcales bacterium]|nr:hypothetical protein [Myxococcales bacterium]